MIFAHVGEDEGSRAEKGEAMDSWLRAVGYDSIVKHALPTSEEWIATASQKQK